MKLHTTRIFLGAIFCSYLINFSCTKEKIINGTPPKNPYDDVNYVIDTSTTSPPDANSIVGIHKNILSVKCANPGCHDGNFEPDYRTVQSSYNTLVYHSVIKNKPDSSFKYRVVPYDTTKSWLHERVTTDDAVLGRMPLYSNILTASELSNINTWIMNGAKDMFGNAAVKPDTRPSITGYIVTDSTFTLRLDTNRVGGLYYNPFIVPQNSTFRIIFFVEDDATAIENMQSNKMKMSDLKNDYSASVLFNAYYFYAPPNYKLWVVDVHPWLYPAGSTHYFRYYINDGNHTSDTEFPADIQPDPYKSYFAFYIQ